MDTLSKEEQEYLAYKYSTLAAPVLNRAAKDSTRKTILFDSEMFFVCKNLAFRKCSGSFNKKLSELKSKTLSTRETADIFCRGGKC